MISERLSLLTKLNATKNFQVVKYVCIYNEDINVYEDRQEEFVKLISEKAKSKLNNKLFVHPCPRDEISNKGYSFAGVYNSYKPLRCLTAEENIRNAVQLIKNNLMSYYGDYYYRCNNLLGNKKIDLLVSCENDSICGFGTGYTSGDCYIVQYYDSPLSIYKKEAKKFKVSNQEISKLSNNIERNIIMALKDIHSQIGEILDVEFVFDRSLNIIVNEVRYLSDAHKRNWVQTYYNNWYYSTVNSCILNTVGTIHRRIKCWEKDCLDDFDSNIDILYVQYESDNQIFKILQLLEGLTQVALIISYPDHIIDNHLAYIIQEDATFNFVLRCVNLQINCGEWICVNSDGFNYQIEVENE